MVLWFYVRKQLKTQRTVVLVFNVSYDSLKSHPADCESQGSNLNPRSNASDVSTTQQRAQNFFVAFLGINQFNRVGLR